MSLAEPHNAGRNAKRGRENKRRKDEGEKMRTKLNGTNNEHHTPPETKTIIHPEIEAGAPRI
jgi:hypothetical protein